MYRASPNFTKFLRTLPVLRRCNQYVRFADGVMFHSGPSGGLMLPQQRCCSAVHGVTPLLDDIGCILFQTTAGTKTGRVLRARGARVEYAIHHCLVTLPLRGKKYCDKFVCLFVCQLPYLKNQIAEIHQILVVVVARSSSGGVAIIMHFRFCG